MEATALVALVDQLKSKRPSGGRGGLGVGKERARSAASAAAGLPDTPLYRRFVPAGAWDPALDSIAPEFTGKRMVFKEEEEAVPAAAADGVAGRKRKRAGSAASAGEATAAAGKKSGKDKGKKDKGKAKAEEEDAGGVSYKRMVLSAVAHIATTAGKGHAKVKHVRKAAAAAAAAAAPHADEATHAAEVDKRLAKLVEQGRLMHLRDGKYVAMAGSSK